MNKLHFTLPHEPRRVWQEHGFVQVPTEPELCNLCNDTGTVVSRTIPGWSFPCPVCPPHGPRGTYIQRSHGRRLADGSEEVHADEPTWHRRHDDIDPLKRARWIGRVQGFCVGILTTIGLLVAVWRLG